MSMARMISSLQLFRKLWSTSLTGWRKVVACGCMCTTLALVCNIIIFTWAYNKPRSDSDTFVLYNGDCQNSKPITTWSHLGINIVSTLVLSGSNYAMQVLVAPTRADADVAHGKKHSVSIGVPSFSNWRYIDRRRQLLYLGLLLTSIPFHTIYNSVIFDTTSAVNYGIYLVTEDFMTATPKPNSVDASKGDSRYLWESISQHQWDNLTKQDCYNTLSQTYVRGYKNLVIVTDVSSATYNESWLANTTQSSRSIELYCEDGTCTPGIATTFEGLSIEFSINTTVSGQRDSIITVSDLVLYCVAEPTQQLCTVELSLYLLGVTIACNIVKIIILILLLWSSFTPLVTIGDAIASYTDEPDVVTKDWGAVFAKDLRAFPRVKSGRPNDNPWLIHFGHYRESIKQAWSNKPSRYFSGASKSRWAWTLWLYFICLQFGATIALNSAATSSKGLQHAWQGGLGSSSPSEIEPWHLGFFGTAVVANLPQLLLSLAYLFYNSVLTSLLLSQEWTNYACHRKGLRVTKPEGQQRSTYFLSLPWKFSIPLMTGSALLHWALSQGIFFVRINYIDYHDLPDPDNSILSVGFSTEGLLLLLSLGLIMISALLLFSFRRYKSGMPLALSDSRAISAACHHPLIQSGKDHRPSLEKLQYGVIADLGQGRYHVGFSSRPVTSLVEGEFYDYRGMLEDS